MKKLIYAICMGAAVAFSSCEDMLDTTNYTDISLSTNRLSFFSFVFGSIPYLYPKESILHDLNLQTVTLLKDARQGDVKYP